MIRRLLTLFLNTLYPGPEPLILDRLTYIGLLLILLSVAFYVAITL